MVGLVGLVIGITPDFFHFLFCFLENCMRWPSLFGKRNICSYVATLISFSGQQCCIPWSPDGTVCLSFNSALKCIWFYFLPFIAGTRYGASLRKQIKKMEVSQHSKYFCEFCGKVVWFYFLNKFSLTLVYWKMIKSLISLLYSMLWKERLLEFGDARTAEKWRQAAPIPWSKNPFSLLFIVTLIFSPSNQLIDFSFFF